MLQAHPELRALVGPSRITAIIIVLVVLVQTALAWVVRDASLAVTLLLAFFVGSHLSFMSFVLIHEASHGLIFESRAANRLAAYVANLPGLVPVAERFVVGHIQHHAHLGEYERDVGLPRTWMARLVGASALRKLLFLLAHPLLYGIRASLLLRGRRSPRRWLLLNVGLQLAFTVAVGYVLGGMSLLYLFVAWYASAGPHPIAIRLHQEHEILALGQETNSYYGPVNTLVFNLGYHNEHHDLPSVAWHRLPKVRRIAPEMYDDLAQPRSWLGSYLGFISGPRRSLFDRCIRGS